MLHPDAIHQILVELQPIIAAELKTARAKKARQKAELKAAKLASVPYSRRRRENALLRYTKSRELHNELAGTRTLSERAAVIAKHSCLASRERGEKTDFATEHHRVLGALKELKK